MSNKQQANRRRLNRRDPGDVRVAEYGRDETHGGFLQRNECERFSAFVDGCFAGEDGLSVSRFCF